MYGPNWLAGKEVAVDVGVTSVTRSSTAKEAAKSRGAAARDYAKSKVLKYIKAACEEKNFDFVPLVVETTGGWLKESKAFLDTLAGKLATKKEITLEEAKCHLFRSLSSTLQHGNMRCILNHHEFSGERYC